MNGQQADGTFAVEKVENLPGSELDRREWLQKRRNGLGGSDAAAVLGLSPWKSPLALWSEKTGLVSEPNLDELEYIEWGQVLEEPIAKKYEKVTGRRLFDHGRFAIRTSDQHPFMHCTIDREIVVNEFIGEKTPGDLSIKNAGAYKAKDWEEEPPLPYQVQLMHELAVTGLQWGSFAVLIGGQKFAWCDVPRNDKFIAHLIEKEEEFWDRVMRGDKPPADASDSTKEVLMRLYPKDTGESKALPAEFAEFHTNRKLLKDQIKAAEEQIQGMDNQIKAAIGEATIGLLPDGSGFSWKAQHRDSYVVQACDYRVLREIKAGKGKK
jgi:putative phage-type endonuclease